MIRITNQYIWNIVFSLFFVGMVFMGMVILDSVGAKTYADLTLLDLTLITLATFRVIRLFVYDSLTKFLREQFYDAKKLRSKIVLEKPKSGPRRTLADLISCPWCFGIWAAGMVTFFYMLTPLAFFPTLLLAVSAIASFLQLVSNAVGWKAEQLKHDTEKLG